jgi:hypothetical protein
LRTAAKDVSSHHGFGNRGSVAQMCMEHGEISVIFVGQRQIFKCLLTISMVIDLVRGRTDAASESDPSPSGNYRCTLDKDNSIGAEVAAVLECFFLAT